MNEILFFLHIILVLGFVLGAARLGKEALFVWVVVQALLANFFVLKQMEFFGFNVTCSDVFIIGSIASLNLLQENFGREIARKAIWTSFFTMLFFALMSQMHLFYTPSFTDQAHGAFVRVLEVTPRLMVASLTSFFIVQQVDIHIFGMLKKKFPRTPLAARSFLPIVVTQFLDTVLFTFLGLYGLGFNLADIIFVSFAIKLIVVVFTIPLNLLASKRPHEV